MCACVCVCVCVCVCEEERERGGGREGERGENGLVRVLREVTKYAQKLH